MVRKGQFQEDLFSSLSVLPLEILPLRERGEESSLLVHYFVFGPSRRIRIQIKALPKKAIESFVNCDWPGDV
jgi:transcriptional regulator with GAF, ATPase, and Fis domain